MTLVLSPPWVDGERMPHPIPNSARRLADEIFRQITEGEIQPGMKLPPERDLAAQHGVTRTTVRQALSLLETYGVIDRRQGSGSFVRNRSKPEEGAVVAAGDHLLDLSELSQITSPLELGVLRSIIEPEIVRLAVLNITGRDIRKMKDIQTELEAVKTDGEAFSQIDDRLRLHLAECTRNPLLLSVCRLTQHVSANADWGKSRRQSLSPGQIGSYAARNRALCQAIENRDVEAAVEHLKLALADFHRDLVRG